MINARGGIIHQSGNEKSSRKGRREPVELFRLLLLVCFRSKASDIHVEPRLDGFQTRLRIDGTMVDVMRVPNQIGIKLTTLVKVLSDIDIAHKNTIQEGHFAAIVPAPKTKAGKRRVDYRVSFAPALHGQKLVIRILDPSNAPLRIADLHLPAWMFESIGSAIRQDSGMILVSGPTGSGKTTSLYALVRSLETTRRNVVTIEDPVEIQIENVTQIPVDEAHDKSFSSLLRSVLRQDPDVLLVGEVRDAETARIAMQAAITGHLVFSTVHTKDTIGTIFRLLDLGVEPYLVAQGLHVVLAQRLARRLCPYCKKPINPTPEQRASMGEAGQNVVKIFAPRGCARCLGTGYAGRQAFFELLVVNDALRDVILSNPSMQDIQKTILTNNSKFVRLSQAAYRLVADGTSPFDEIERIVGRER
jgi:type II secretory ATPase GspE/PulE/Tfp pilus assembly ATPase PilB-like protein